MVFEIFLTTFDDGVFSFFLCFILIVSFFSNSASISGIDGNCPFSSFGSFVMISVSYSATPSIENLIYGKNSIGIELIDVLLYFKQYRDIRLC